MVTKWKRSGLWGMDKSSEACRFVWRRRMPYKSRIHSLVCGLWQSRLQKLQDSNPKGLHFSATSFIIPAAFLPTLIMSFDFWRPGCSHDEVCFMNLEYPLPTIRKLTASANTQSKPLRIHRFCSPSYGLVIGLLLEGVLVLTLPFLFLCGSLVDFVWHNRGLRYDCIKTPSSPVRWSFPIPLSIGCPFGKSLYFPDSIQNRTYHKTNSKSRVDLVP